MLIFLFSRFDRAAWHLHYNLADIGADVNDFINNVVGSKEKFVTDYIGDFRNGAGLKYFTRTPKPVVVKKGDEFGNNFCEDVIYSRSGMFLAAT